MNKNQIETIYEIVNKQDKNRYELYNEVKTPSENSVIVKLVQKLGLENTEETRLACVDRIVGVREESIVNIFKELNYSEDKIEELKAVAYDFTADFYQKEHNETLEMVLESDIPQLYKIIFEGVYRVGMSLTVLHKAWFNHIVLDINPTLIKEQGSIANAMKYLDENNLFDLGHNNEKADRSYSVLIKTESGYTVKTYAEAFENEIKEVVQSIDTFLLDSIGLMMKIDDPREWSNWLAYFTALKNAFLETDRHQCVAKWAEVDRKWMELDGPIQVVHPLEYYDDNLRNAVSIEFDLRIDNPASLENTRSEKIEKMFLDKMTKYESNSTEKMKTLVKKNIKKVQLHIGKQVFFCGSQLTGLASAQVIPNDEVVSDEKGKKIFAFVEKSVELGQAKPNLLINRQIFGKEIIEKNIDLLFNRVDDFVQVYDITTIGHEYGHVLFKGADTEVKMNVNGNFKNIEEFKASAGGIVSFFDTPEEDKLWEEVFLNTLQRAVKLIAWKNVDEVRPYYCEALITLNILFDSGVLVFRDNKLNVDIEKDVYQVFKSIYKDYYNQLVDSYIKEENADNYLMKFVEDVNGEYLPKKDDIKSFVLYYHKLNQEIGREIDPEYS